ncbi:MAG: lipopolysaccharide kinase InaA family protein [Prevotella sp.]|jgi:tRNA A-37 threonylcarbamoyl transferase component Bud32|nr:lipopolysaccharide kinase InaA family protein [Prevotella sp.]
MMKFLINKDYQGLESWIHAIPEEMFTVDKVFCKDRNQVVLTHFQDKKMVIKRYKRPTFFNCIVYSFIRKSKPERAFYNALKLQKKGVDTATPIAYIVKKRWGLYDTGWFVSEYLKEPTLKSLCTDMPKEDLKKLSYDFAMFSMSLFKKGIIDKDFNSSNIMVTEEAGNYHFALVDINRMEWGKTNLAQQMRTMERLDLKPMELNVFLSMYADICKKDLEKCYFFTYWFKIKRRTIVRGREWLKARFHILKVCDT